MYGITPAPEAEPFRQRCVLQRLAAIVDDLDEWSHEHYLEPLDLIFQYLELTPRTNPPQTAGTSGSGRSGMLEDAGLRDSFLGMQSDFAQIENFKERARSYVALEGVRALQREAQADGTFTGPTAERTHEVDTAEPMHKTLQLEEEACRGQREQLFRDILDLTEGSSRKPAPSRSSMTWVDTLRLAALWPLASRSKASPGATEF